MITLRGKMKLRLIIPDKDLMGSTLPRWYGIAYRRLEYRESVLYIIPLNVVVRYARKIYWLLYAWLKHNGWRDKLDDAYESGWREGRKVTDAHYERLVRIIKGEE